MQETSSATEIVTGNGRQGPAGAAGDPLNQLTTIGGFGDTGIIGTDGDIRLSDGRITLVTHGPTDPDGRPGNCSQVVQTFPVPREGKVLEKVGRIFAEAVRSGDGRRLLSFRHVRHEYEILDALRQSARTGQAVDVGGRG